MGGIYSILSRPLVIKSRRCHSNVNTRRLLRNFNTLSIRMVSELIRRRSIMSTRRRLHRRRLSSFTSQRGTGILYRIAQSSSRENRSTSSFNRTMLTAVLRRQSHELANIRLMTYLLGMASLYLKESISAINTSDSYLRRTNLSYAITANSNRFNARQCLRFHIIVRRTITRTRTRVIYQSKGFAVRFRNLTLTRPRNTGTIENLGPFRHFRTLLRILDHLMRPLLFNTNYFLVSRSAYVLITFFHALPLNISLPYFFPLFFSNNFGTLTLTRHLFMSDHLGFTFFFFLSRVIKMIAPRFKGATIFRLPSLIRCLVRGVAIVTRGRRNSVGYLRLSSRGTSTILIRITHELVDGSHTYVPKRHENGLNTYLLSTTRHLLHRSNSIRAKRRLAATLDHVGIRFVRLTSRNGTTRAPSINIHGNGVTTRGFGRTNFTYTVISRRTSTVMKMSFRLFSV